jgi:hypothetical protein
MWPIWIGSKTFLYLGFIIRGVLLVCKCRNILLIPRVSDIPVNQVYKCIISEKYYVIKEDAIIFRTESDCFLSGAGHRDICQSSKQAGPLKNGRLGRRGKGL